MTSSTGCSGLIFFGSPPIALIASRIAARSTTAGTPVKSCSSTRPGGTRSRGSARPWGPSRPERAMSSRVDGDAVLVAQQVLEQDLQRERQPCRPGTARAARRAGRSRTLRPSTSSAPFAAKLSCVMKPPSGCRGTRRCAFSQSAARRSERRGLLLARDASLARALGAQQASSHAASSVSASIPDATGRRQSMRRPRPCPRPGRLCARRSSARAGGRGAAHVGVGQDHHELVAAVTGDTVDERNSRSGPVRRCAASRRRPGGRGRRSPA